MYTQTFMTFKIPEMCHDKTILEKVAERFNSAKQADGWCKSTVRMSNRGCSGVMCTECILCDNAGSIPAECKRQAFATYLHTQGIPVTRPGYNIPPVEEHHLEAHTSAEAMLELKPGMLIQLDTSVYIVCINSDYGYRVIPRDNRVVISSLWRIPNEHISKIWYSKLEPGCALSVGFIQDIINGILPSGDDPQTWEKPESKATKMTLEEISQALGYEVEIVDEKTHVDLGVKGGEAHVDLGVKGFADRI